jgi:thiosulfate/3-mercaptopyruvate sulfurtransferase
VAGALLLGTLVSGAAPQANPRLLIDTAELAMLLGRPAVRVVDLRADAVGGEAAYLAGHIPGAVHLVSRTLDDPTANAQGLPIHPEAAASLFSRLGIDHETTVVAYDDGGSVQAARLFLVLETFGHRSVRVLDGGLGKWQREGRALERGTVRVEPRRFVPHPRRAIGATAADVQARLGKPEVCLLDARSPAEFQGTDVRARRGGHIPGAVNVDWVTTMNPDQTFKDIPTLRTILEGAGVLPDREVVAYCQSGMRAAHSYFVLRLLGYAWVRTYDGSWNEWGNNPALPLQR